MRLVTLNTWQGRMSRNFEPFFKGLSADFICLQELNDSESQVPSLDIFQTLKKIKDASRLEHEYYSPVYEYQVMGQRVRFGNGVLSRFPTNRYKTIFTNGSHQVLSRPTDYRPNTRNAQILGVTTPQGNLTLVNHHAYWAEDPMGNDASLLSLEKLARKLKTTKGPLIVAGDFNLRASSKAVKFFINELKLRDLTYVYKLENTLSGLVTPYVVDCDHIFVSSEVGVENFRVDQTLLSDHRALVLDFNLKN